MADRTESVILEFQVDVDQSIVSIDKLTAANKKLRAERNALNIASEEGKKQAAVLNAQIDQNTAKIKANVSAIEQQKINIGNYKSALDGINPAFGKVAAGLEKGINGMKGLSLASKAFIATGIGAVIAALGLAFAALTKYFQGSEEGQNRLNKIVAIGSAIFEQFMNVVEDVGEVIFDAIENPQQALKDFGQLVKDQIINRFTGMLELIPNIGRVIGLLFQGKFQEAAKVAADSIGKVTLGVENATDKVSGFIERTNEGIQKGIDFGTKISDLNAKIDKEERKLIEDRAKINLEVSKLRQKAVEAEGKARIDATKQAIALEESLSAREVALDKTRLQLAELRVQANGDDKEALNAVAEARAKVTQAEALAYDNTLKFRKQLQGLIEEQTKLEEEAAADARARQRAESGGEVGTNDPVIDAEFKRAEVIGNIRERLNKDLAKLDEKRQKEARERALKQVEIDKIADEQRIQGAQAVSSAILGFLDEQSTAYKAIATAQTLISTYSAATKAYEAAFLPIPTVASPALGVAFAAAAVAQGLAQVAKINGVEFAEGGWTGPGKKWDVAGVVHADEYVVPKHIVHNPAAAHHVSALERMRLQPYADGGLVTRSVSNPINQSLEIGNLLKNLGPFEVSVKEVTKMQNRVKVKQQISKR